MEDNALSQALFPGLDFCEPTDDKMVEAAHAWITLVSRGGTPLPHGGPSWGTGTVTTGDAIVFSRDAEANIREYFHWRDGRCTAHDFTVGIKNVRVTVDVEGDREGALFTARRIEAYVKGWLGLPEDAVDDDEDIGAPHWEKNDEDSGVGP